MGASEGRRSRPGSPSLPPDLPMGLVSDTEQQRPQCHGDNLPSLKLESALQTVLGWGPFRPWLMLRAEADWATVSAVGPLDEGRGSCSAAQSEVRAANGTTEPSLRIFPLSFLCCG